MVGLHTVLYCLRVTLLLHTALERQTVFLEVLPFGTNKFVTSKIP